MSVIAGQRYRLGLALNLLYSGDRTRTIARQGRTAPVAAGGVFTDLESTALSHHIQVAAGGERAAGAGDDGDARSVVSVEGEPDLRQLPVQTIVGRIQHLGTVDGDENHSAVPALERKVLVVAVVDGRLPRHILPRRGTDDVERRPPTTV